MFNFFKTKKVREVREVLEIPNFSERDNYLENKRLEFENKLSKSKTNEQLQNEIYINVCKKVDNLLILLNKSDNGDKCKILILIKELNGMLKPDAETDHCQKFLYQIEKMVNKRLEFSNTLYIDSIIFACNSYNARVNEILCNPF
jgi:hypothetical protein